MLQLRSRVRVLLAACGHEIPRSFAAPAEEISRVEDAADAECQELRSGYWFCEAKAGFVHVYTRRPAGAAEQMVSEVMLEGEPGLNAAVAALYGFETADLDRLAAQGEPVAKGGFELVTDPTWHQPVIRVNAGG